ncbi:family 78 glycoside hydrolase catalytic domain [Paludicola sp. MB14-C6]|uniref:family 78 glycoside hydrolase catalytic domain n=1 Tax=Paludihabitans sp. MB14-C6 TaxID=3070656 RepID=UPI0027DB163E|nr:family 78 glycoside hydrolase catalytic domain [Paludicola sp. MB14-C6]WMJ23177.1 family 78 glycoside hydrolase catalytic domain [Paludicola sp. MB14-C6]
MNYPTNFISATTEFCDLEKHVNAPYLRKSFNLEGNTKDAKLIISGLGFYDAYINGKRINKGELMPYISASDDIVFFDEYDVTKYLQKGENVFGAILGNGMHNCLGGGVWDFQKAAWRSAPMLALRFEIQLKNGQKHIIETDDSFKTAPSPITFDDLRCGEDYDANLEQLGWNNIGFDDSNWENVMIRENPKGDYKISNVEPITLQRELKPIDINKISDGVYSYKFYENAAGVVRLKISGTKNQKVTMCYTEMLEDGVPSLSNITFSHGPNRVQTCSYTLKGDKEETYIPRFTYNGFRYVKVTGITDEQATKDLLTYLVWNTNLTEMGNFECSDQVANTLQLMTRRSTLANFFHFPTDCPHREKNGWTGDAALSCEHTLINLTPEKCYRQWLDCIRKAQDKNGAFPGIVPTGGWGFHWGNGPGWDSIITYLPYFMYKYRGDIEVLRENSDSIHRYIEYMKTKINDDGLFAYGLADWCSPKRPAEDPKTPLEVTDSIICIDICDKASFIFEIIGDFERRDNSKSLAKATRNSFRKKYVNSDNMTVSCETQTAQAMALFYNIFTQDEEKQAFVQLLKLIDKEDKHIDCGIFGARVIFHVLSKFGYSDLAYYMITRKEYPSYGAMIDYGNTTLGEFFENIGSYNHHFYGDISNWFITDVLGIKLNPTCKNANEIIISPSFIFSLQYAKGYHNAPAGKISVEYKKSVMKLNWIFQHQN